MEQCLKLVNNHDMHVTLIDKQNYLYLYDSYLSVILPIHQTTFCNVRDYWGTCMYLTFFFFFSFFASIIIAINALLFLFCRNLGNHLVAAIFCFLKRPCLFSSLGAIQLLRLHKIALFRTKKKLSPLPQPLWIGKKSTIY